MSFPMVHLKVAYELLARYGDGRIERLGDFLLGSVAPDAVHFHNEYDVSLKERSHLWKSDWENDRSIWTPFREKMMQGTEVDEVHERYAAEAYGFDQWLYQTDENSKEIWQLLEQGCIYGVGGCILEEDLARQKKSLLVEQFTGEKVYDVSGYQFCTKEILEGFVKKCVEDIEEAEKILLKIEGTDT